MATNEQAVRTIPKRTHSYNNAPLNSNNGRRNSNPVTPNDIHVTDTGIVREKQGKVYCDNKPPKVDIMKNGDFSVEGVEFMLNPNFETNTSWGGAVAIDTRAEQLRKTSGGLGYQTTGGITAGTSYEVVLDVASLDGATALWLAGNSYPLSVGIQTIYAIGGTNSWNGGRVGINNGYSSGVGSVFNSISLKELGQFWSLGGGWGIGSGVATHNGSTSANISQNVPLVVGTAYDITYTVVNASAGSQIGIAPNSLNIQYPRTSDGTYTETFTASLTNLYIRSLWNNGNPVSVDNISLSRTVLETEYLYHEVLVRDEFNNLVALVRNSNEGDISTGSYENNQGVKNRPIPRTSRIDGRPSRNFNADGSKTL